MQFTLVSLLLASTTISQIAAAPVPIAFQSQWTHLQKRDEQATQAQNAAQQQADTAAQATTQDLHAVNAQDAQAAEQKPQAQQAQNGVQRADARQSQNAKDLSIDLGSGGLGLNLGGGSPHYSDPYQYGYNSYAQYGCATCCTTCGYWAGYTPAVANPCGGLLSGLVCAVDAILKRK